MILAVRRTHVIHEPCIWPSSPPVLCSSVVRASDRCTEGKALGSIPVGDFFLVLCLWHVDQLISHFFTGLKIYHLSLFKNCCLAGGRKVLNSLLTYHSFFYITRTGIYQYLSRNIFALHQYFKARRLLLFREIKLTQVESAFVERLKPQNEILPR